jgi:hypothetical protein
MSGFKVGDIVVGNNGANGYFHTKEGSVVEVVKTYSATFFGKVIESSSGLSVGSTFSLSSSAFDLQTTPEDSQSTDELIAENVSLKKQIASLEERLETKRSYLASNLGTIESRVATAS